MDLSWPEETKVPSLFCCCIKGGVRVAVLWWVNEALMLNYLSSTKLLLYFFFFLEEETRESCRGPDDAKSHWSMSRLWRHSLTGHCDTLSRVTHELSTVLTEGRCMHTILFFFLSLPDPSLLRAKEKIMRNFNYLHEQQYRITMNEVFGRRPWVFKKSNQGAHW